MDFIRIHTTQTTIAINWNQSLINQVTISTYNRFLLKLNDLL